jgi:hypothetical protein
MRRRKHALTENDLFPPVLNPTRQKAGDWVVRLDLLIHQLVELKQEIERYATRYPRCISAEERQRYDEELTDD